MTRPFRVEADERRYLALRSEFLIRLVSSGLNPQTVTEIMRNFGKMEDMLFFEGVRQGMVVALLREPGEWNMFDAVELHCVTYRDAQTPLTRAEDAYMDQAIEAKEPPCQHEDHPWLNDAPLEFGPSTLTEALEAYGPDLKVTGAPARVRAPVDKRTNDEKYVDALRSTVDLDDADDHDAANFLAEQAAQQEADVQAAAYADAEAILAELAALGQAGVDVAPEDDQPVERPELLDRIRDILLAMQKPPENWSELIMMLHRELEMDAGWIDMTLSSPMGMTVISQAKMFHLHPGSMAMVGEDGTVVTR